MTPIDFTNDQNTMGGVILRLHLHIKYQYIRIEDNTRNGIMFTIIQDTLAKLGG